MEIGDRVKDQDGTIGIIVELKGTWVRYRCRPYAILANLLTGKDVLRERVFWNMKRNVEAKE